MSVAVTVRDTGKYITTVQYALGRVHFCHKHPNMLADVFIVSLGELINHKQFQQASSTPSWSNLQFKFTMGIIMGNKPKKHFLMVLVQI